VGSHNRFEGEICTKVYPLFREEREEVRDFIQEQMRERYI